MNKMVKHIKEYFNTFPNKDYTIYVDGVPAEWCCLDDNTGRVVWDIPSDNSDTGRSWFWVNVRDIEAIRLTSTTMEIVKTNGKEYNFVAKRKTKEEKAKNLILKAKNTLNVHLINVTMDYLNELEALMDE